MSRFSAYLRNAASLLEIYEGKEPFSSYLKKYFGEHKKFGSTDRKQISSLCYRFFRIGKWAQELEVSKRLLLAEFLLAGKGSPYFKDSPIDWEVNLEKKLLDKGLDTGISLLPEQHATWYANLQPLTPANEYVKAMLSQPDLFLRIRPGMEKNVIRKLQNSGVPFMLESENTIRLPISSNAANILDLNKEAVVQDLNSQQCGHIIKKNIPKIEGAIWDVCAASGGKSLLLHDLYGGIKDLIVTDIRPSILHNLTLRFRQANISNFKQASLDLTKPLPKGFFKKPPQVILIDAPCTGSGTWPRTPEQHCYFNPVSLSSFQKRQYDICCNAINHLKAGNYLIYITCSVFSMENEEVVIRLAAEFPINLLHREVVNGFGEKADGMFIAIFQHQ